MIALHSPRLSAEINPQGAELHALRDSEGRDLLWSGDPAVWSGRAPVLFPIVGALNQDRYRWHGQTYTLPKHGFARRRLFQVIHSDPSSATLRLDWDEQTFAAYPFQFQLDLRFALDGATLSMTATIRNLDRRTPLWASFGFHPALVWPLPYGQAKAGHSLTFAQPEPAPIRRIDAAGLLRPAPEPSPVQGRELMLNSALFEDDAIIFDRLASRALSYGAGGGPGLDIAFPDTGLLGVWQKPGADYICIEPWRGIADPEGFDGELSDKPGMMQIAPDQAARCTMSVTLRG